MPATIIELHKGFELGPWTVMPERGLLRQGEVEERLEPMVMDVLVVLASHQGGVVTKEQLIDVVWGGRETADEAIAVKIGALRNKLGDDSKNPKYIETVPRRGYRLKMPVGLPIVSEAERRSAFYLRTFWPPVVVGLSILAITAIVLWPSSKPIDSIAVMQFKNLSDDKEKFQYVVDGLTDEIVNSLHQVPKLKIVRGPELTEATMPASIISDFGVDEIVTGSVRRYGDQIRITAQLIDATNFQRWSNSIHGAANEVFSLQERVAGEVRDAILGEKGEQLRAASRPADPEAFDTYMRGLFFLGKRDAESLARARDLFHEYSNLPEPPGLLHRSLDGRTGVSAPRCTLTAVDR